MGTGELDAVGNPEIKLDYQTRERAAEIERTLRRTIVFSCYRNRDKLWNDGPLGSYADFLCLILWINFWF